MSIRETPDLGGKVRSAIKNSFWQYEGNIFIYIIVLSFIGSNHNFFLVHNVLLGSFHLYTSKIIEKTHSGI